MHKEREAKKLSESHAHQTRRHQTDQSEPLTTKTEQIIGRRTSQTGKVTGKTGRNGEFRGDKKQQQGCRVSSISQDRKWTSKNMRQRNGSGTKIKAGRAQIMKSSHTQGGRAEDKYGTCHMIQPAHGHVFLCGSSQTQGQELLAGGLICHTSERRDAPTAAAGSTFLHALRIAE